jgi:hypothetical protein
LQYLFNVKRKIIKAFRLDKGEIKGYNIGRKPGIFAPGWKIRELDAPKGANIKRGGGLWRAEKQYGNKR